MYIKVFLVFPRSPRGFYFLPPGGFRTGGKLCSYDDFDCQMLLEIIGNGQRYSSERWFIMRRFSAGLCTRCQYFEQPNYCTCGIKTETMIYPAKEKCRDFRQAAVPQYAETLSQ